jgi:predicted AlkP superfamily pyrophosphatase or phosphodiesterase
MKYLIIVFFLLSISSTAQQKKATSSDKPKLVVGIVVDQMRYDYLYRFYDKYSSFGIKRLMNEGFNCRNNQYHYAATITGPGHAHVYSGSAPAISGIVGNEWFDKVINKSMYVVADSTVKVVGDGTDAAGKMSPRNMKVTTITDQLRIASQFKSKVIGIAFKDRGSILPAGHTGMAYWYDASKGNWITSSYYTDVLPKWVSDFNAKKLPQSYITNLWEPLMPLENYFETEGDDQAYEAPMSGETKAVFPHKVTLGSLAQSYYGNDLTTRFALEAFESEKLGMGKETDFLAVSFSTPDYAGHAFGAQSKEIEDIYLRFDKNIEELLRQFDKKLGAGNYSVFLTADHGVAEIPAFLRKHNIPAGLFLGSELKATAEKVLKEKFGDGNYLLDSDNYQYYLDHAILAKKGISIRQVTDALKEKMEKMDGIYKVVNLEEAMLASLPDYYKNKLTNLYNPKRSGEIMVLVEPAWFSGYVKGTTHGTMYAYDTHVPLLFFGWGINKGETVKPTAIADIAPTLAMLLKILEPNGSVGQPIPEVLKH